MEALGNRDGRDPRSWTGTDRRVERRVAPSFYVTWMTTLPPLNGVAVKLFSSYTARSCSGMRVRRLVQRVSFKRRKGRSMTRYETIAVPIDSVNRMTTFNANGRNASLGPSRTKIG
jgi:hypothetical protein